MFIIANGSAQILNVMFTREQVKQAIQKRIDTYRRQWGQSGNYMSRSYPNLDAMLGTQMRNMKVLELPDEPIDLGWDSTRTTISKGIDITPSFFVIREEQVKVGEHITARVVKKGLKSTGRTVTVQTTVNRGANTVAPTPKEFKELYDQLARIVCHIDGWGSVTLAPDSLDEYRMTPKMKPIFVFSFAE